MKLKQLIVTGINKKLNIMKKEIIDKKTILKAATKHSKIYIEKAVAKNAFYQGAKWYSEQLKSIQCNSATTK